MVLCLGVGDLGGPDNVTAAERAIIRRGLSALPIGPHSPFERRPRHQGAAGLLLSRSDVFGGKLQQTAIIDPTVLPSFLPLSIAHLDRLDDPDGCERLIASGEPIHQEARPAPWYRAPFPAMRPAKDTGTELVTTAGDRCDRVAAPPSAPRTRGSVGKGRAVTHAAHRPRRIGLRPCDARDNRQRGSARGQLQKTSTGNRCFG